MQGFRAVLFDLDGTLTPVPSVWQEIHEALGLWHHGAEANQRAFAAGLISYQEFCDRDAACWKGMRESELRSVTDRIPYRSGAPQIVERIQRSGRLVGVVSTGLTLLADRVHRELDLAYTRANRLIVREGVLTGEVEVNVVHGGKDAVVDRFCGTFGLMPHQIITVGDSEGDISMFERSGFSVALNARDTHTGRAASATCESDSLLELWEILPLTATMRGLESGFHNGAGA